MSKETTRQIDGFCQYCNYPIYADDCDVTDDYGIFSHNACIPKNVNSGLNQQARQDHLDNDPQA